MTNKINNNLLNIIHKSFVNYDIMGFIGNGLPEDEYQLEENKLLIYLSNFNVEEIDNSIILNGLKEIFLEWLGDKIMKNHSEYYNEVIQKISNEISNNLKSTYK